MLALLLATSTYAATPVLGVEWRPLSRADITWVDDDRTTGTGVAEFDGTAHPNLTAFGGAWIGDRVAVLGSLGIARVQSTVWFDVEGADAYRQRHWGVVRPALDVRWSILPRTYDGPVPWLLIGAHGDIPSARDVSNAYSEEEQEIADEDAYIERLRIGGLGGRVGGGADVRLGPGIALGLQYTVTWHRGVLRSSEQDTITSWVGGEAALLLAFEWEKKSQ